MAVKNGKNNDKQTSRGEIFGQFMGQIMLAVLGLLVVTSIYSYVVEDKKETGTVSLSAIVADVNAGSVKKIEVSGDDLALEYVNGDKKTSKKESESGLVETLTGAGVTPEALRAVEIDIKTPSGSLLSIFNVIFSGLSILLFLVFLWFISRQIRGASMQALSFGQSRARIIDPNDKGQKVTFKDVAGVKEAKIELEEIVDFLKNPKKFLDIGAKIPKGVLLMGAPGAGKTLLARAVAGEADVPFLYLSGSEFVEMFVGVGASRVRDLFDMAKKAAPAIIFIDEIDAIGRHRGSGMGGGNDEREQTLNQILVEMDGFEPTEKLIVMAATNRPDVLDPALLRPGRFDRRVMLDLPDINDREAILNIHATKKPLAEDVQLRVIAERTPGFSGADLANVMNEGAILAARENRKKVSQYDLIRSVEKVMLGPERKSFVLNDKEKRITAYHEMGHALVSSVLEHSDPVHKVSIISRGHAAGYTLKLPFEDKKLQARQEFLDDIAMSLGGYATEQLIFGDITTGASNDIEVASGLARSMVAKYGMSPEIGPVNFEGGGTSIMLGKGAMAERVSSEAMAAKIDSEVSKIMKEALARANKVLADHRDALDGMSEELIKKETIEREDFEKLLILYGIKPKTRNQA